MTTTSTTWNQTKENWRKMAEWKWIGSLLLPFFRAKEERFVWSTIVRVVLFSNISPMTFHSCSQSLSFYISFNFFLFIKTQCIQYIVENCRQAGSDVFGGCWLHRSCVLWWFYLSPKSFWAHHITRLLQRYILSLWFDPFRRPNV